MDGKVMGSSSSVRNHLRLHSSAKQYIPEVGVSRLRGNKKRSNRSAISQSSTTSNVDQAEPAGPEDIKQNTFKTSKSEKKRKRKVREKKRLENIREQSHICSDEIVFSNPDATTREGALSVAETEHTLSRIMDVNKLENITTRLYVHNEPTGKLVSYSFTRHTSTMIDGQVDSSPSVGNRLREDSLVNEYIPDVVFSNADEKDAPTETKWTTPECATPKEQLLENAKVVAADSPGKSTPKATSKKDPSEEEPKKEAVPVDTSRVEEQKDTTNVNEAGGKSKLASVPIPNQVARGSQAQQGISLKAKAVIAVAAVACFIIVAHMINII